MMERYIKPGETILDIGGGPGRYAFYFLDKGNPVILTDLSDGNIDFALQEAKKQGINLQALACDALEIRKHVHEHFDHVFLMGPMYHLMTKEERAQAVREALSMLKPNGLIYISFLMLFSGVIYMLRQAPHMVIEPSEEIWLDAVRNQRSWGGVAFTRAFFIDQNEIMPFMAQFDLDILHFFGQEGITSANSLTLMEQPEEIQEAWIQLSVDLCEIPKYLSHSEHAMVIARKVAL